MAKPKNDHEKAMQRTELDRSAWMGLDAFLKEPAKPDPFPRPKLSNRPNKSLKLKSEG